MTATEAARELKRKREELAAIYRQYDTKEFDSVTGVPVFAFPDGMREEIANRQSELETLHDQHQKLEDAEIAQKNQAAIANLNQLNRTVVHAGGGRSSGPTYQGKSLGQIVTESWGYKNARDNGTRKFVVDLEEVDYKTLLTTAGTPGYVPPNPRSDLALPYLTRPIRLPEIIPTVETNNSEISWMEETSFTNNASMTGEGYTKPESAVDWDLKTTTIRKVATWIPVTEEQVDDVPGFMQLIDNDLTTMIRLKEEQQILNGTGVGQELTGILQHASIQTQAFSTNNADTVLKGMTLISWTGYGNPSHVVLNPSNWETVRLYKDTVNGYVLGSPMIETTPRLWGLPVILTNLITAGTGLVGDFRMGATIHRKMGVRIDVSDSHSTYFVENKLAVRAESRLALQIKRPSFFVKLTSLT